MFNKNLYKYFSLIFVPYLAVISAAFATFLTIQHLHNLNLIKKNEVLQIDLARKSLVRDLRAILPDIEVLANERHLKQFIKHPTVANRRLLEEEIISFSRNKRIYRQIRLLDLQGQEVVRVDYDNELAHGLPADILQNKADRYYFLESITLGESELYLSPLDLNIEHGIVETPHHPTIRFAMPVFDDEGNKRGVIVFNYQAKYLLDHFDEMLSGTYGHIGLLNQDGYWLRSHKKHREWAFMFDRNIRFDHNHPKEWQEISSNESGQIHTSDGLFTFSSVFPLKLIGGYQPGEKKRDHGTHQHSDPLNYSWKIVSDVPTKILNQKVFGQLLGPSGLIWLLLTTMGVFTSWYLALTILERRRLRSQNELHAKIYATSTDGIIITDANENMIDINTAFESISGYSRDEIIGRKPLIFRSGRHDKNFYENLWTEINQNGYWEGEIYNRHKDGGIYIEWIRISAIKDSKGNVSNYIALVSDITKQKTTEEQLLKHAHHDPLTGAHNRLSFDERLIHDLAHAQRNNRKLALLYIDLDKFKPINDQLGHQSGDVVLQTVADRIMDNIRQTDTLARIGGDEFIIILSDIEDYSDAEAVAQKIKQAIKLPIAYQENTMSVEASIGIATYPLDGTSKEELIHCADEDMYRDKNLPRDS
ncbi:MAG: diguanylate cyclase [Gammaproteobacteria bacterium]|nr:diguanylate cyclase [Gammaproteobacteria bacterium]